MFKILYNKTLFVECTVKNIEEEDLKDTKCQQWLLVGGGIYKRFIITVGTFAVSKFSAMNMH